MRKTLLATLLLLLTTPALLAQNWSFGAGVGAFGFGTFVERTLRVGNETDRTTNTLALSASARPGVALDLERRLSDRWGVRGEVSFTHAPMSVKNKTGGTGATIEAGTVNVTTASLPIVLHFQRHGAVNVQLFAGPAFAAYDVHQRTSVGTVPLFAGERNRWGGMAGGGLDWWFTPKVAAEGELMYINTSSPFSAADVSSPTRSGIHIPRTQNVESRFGLRYRF